jgi:hypothetical protein
MSRGETALADRRREIDVPTRVEKVPYLSPGAVVHEQVVAFGDDERHEAFDGGGDRRSSLRASSVKRSIDGSMPRFCLLVHSSLSNRSDNSSPFSTAACSSVLFSTFLCGAF